MSPEGKPIQVNAGALQAAAAQNVAGMLDTIKEITERYFNQELSIVIQKAYFQVVLYNIKHYK